MFRWTPYAFIRIAAFFIGGILLGVYNPGIIPIQIAGILVGVLVTLFFLLFLFFKGLPRNYFGLIALPAVFFAGYSHVHIQKHTNQPDHLSFHQDSIQYYRAVITKFSDEKLKSWKTEASVSTIFSRGRWIKVKANVLLYFAKSDFDKPFSYGDVILVRGSPAPMTPPANPGEFDYKRYLSFRNVYHQHFLKKDAVRHCGNDAPSTFIRYAYLSRTWCQQMLEKYVRGEREQAVASALVLGVTDGLDHELLNAYSSTGAMHVLAVSGLHISILYMIIMWLLKPLLKLRSGPWLLALISLLLLWLYAFITGLSPSVLRAVTMFSFMALARPTGQTTNIFNTLGASAFFLLLFDPFLIMSVGFQLSYLAVLGIVYLQSGLYNLWSPSSYLLDEIWKISCVSIAAQVSTFSLGLLYFHQFPNYFLLSNLLVIPGSFVVLILGIVVLAVGVIEIAGVVFGFLLTWSIKFINFVVFVVESFPFSLVENIYITTFQSWLIMMAITSVVFVFQFRKFRFFVFAVAIMIVFAAEQWHHHNNAFKITKFTVYNVAGHTAFDFIEDGQAIFFTDSVLHNDRDRLRFHIHPNRLRTGVQKVVQVESLGLLREVGGVKVFFWKEKFIALQQNKRTTLPDNTRFDVLIIGMNAASVADLQKLKYPPRLIILDSSNSYFYTQSFREQAIKAGMKVHSLRFDGAYEEFFDRTEV